MGLIESEADAIAWAHQMAKTPTPGDHEVADPHPYCLGDDPCCCVQLIAACETARADERDKAAGRVERLTAYRTVEECQGDALETADPNDPDPYLQGHLLDRDDTLAAIREAE